MSDMEVWSIYVLILGISVGDGTILLPCCFLLINELQLNILTPAIPILCLSLILLASTLSALNHSFSSPTHQPKSMDVAVLGETIDEILTRIPSLATTTASGTGLSANDTEQLKQYLNDIQDVVHREKQKNHFHGDHQVLVNWMRNLKTVVNDLSDLVEEISAINASPQEKKLLLPTLLLLLLLSFLKPNPFKNRVKVINSKIKKVKADLQNVAKKLPPATTTSSSELEASKKETKLDPAIEKSLELVGREKEKKEIIDHLISLRTKTGESDVVPIPVVTIVGFDGIGKTELACLICRDKKVKDHFGSQIWVDVINKSETPIVDYIEERVNESDGNGYLVVLDGLRTEVGEEDLSKLQQILTGRPGGGAILITTRSKLVANKITANIRGNLLELVGREKLKKEIIDQLISLRTKTGESDVVPVPVVTIVGFNGIGKTGLANLICRQVKAHFGHQIWVENHETETLDLASSIEKRVSDSPETNGKGYLVVLNDLRQGIGEEDLSKLQQILTGRPGGGAILITTRSKLVANKITANIRGNLLNPDVHNNITTVKPHVLQGLNEEDSWSLFCRIGGPSSIGVKDDDDMARQIVKDCGGVPLWIIITATLVNNRRRGGGGGEAPVSTLKEEFLEELKLRYYDKLPRLQKLCFAFCSLFPRDHLMDVERIIHLLTAEGLILMENSNAEEIFRGYFNDFVGRSIFKDTEEDERGVVKRCGMQPLMHDLARFVADQVENITVDPEGERVHERVLRASFDYSLDVSRGIPDSLFEKAKKLRAILLWETHTLIPKEMKTSTSTCDKICKTFKTTLRMLDLHNMGIKTLPSSIGQLINLRYLDLSLNKIEKLPGSITKLSNLQTLKLSQCYLLKELPKNIEDLINLKHLEIEGCLALTHMPRKIHKLKSLQTLSLFVVSEGYHLGGLGELASLNNLRGHLEILHLERLNMKLSVTKDNCLNGKKHLQRLTLRWSHEDDQEDDRDKNTMDCLEPHSEIESELRVLFLVGYKGSTLSSWLSSIQCLVKLSLYDCTSCKFLPQLDQLQKLRFLELLRLTNLEFIADEPAAVVFFPSLEELTISDCPKLKSWWKTNKKENDFIHFFPCISKLHVYYCPVLTCMPLYPCLDQELVLVDSSVQPLQDTIVCASRGYNPFSKLKSMQIASIHEEHSPPENWPSSLEKLDIRDCSQLKSLPKGFDHLSSLQRLTIENCRELDLDLSSTEWEGLKNLRSLTIRENPKLKSLPLGVDKVTSMQDLELHNCPEMTSFPESIGNLKSLGRLVISECNKLASLPKGLKNLESLHTLIILDCTLLSPRCQPDTGDDWPQICHIKNIQVMESLQDI